MTAAPCIGPAVLLQEQLPAGSTYEDTIQAGAPGSQGGQDSEGPDCAAGGGAFADGVVREGGRPVPVRPLWRGQGAVRGGLQRRNSGDGAFGAAAHSHVRPAPGKRGSGAGDGRGTLQLCRGADEQPR